MSSSNLLPNIPPAASSDVQNSIINQVIDLINAQQRTQTISDDTSNRYLFGFQKNGWPGGSFGIKVSPPGQDVATTPFKSLLYAQDFSTGTQYFNNGGNTYAEIGIPGATGNIKIAKVGKDVDTAGNTDLIFNSAQDIFKIAKKIPITFNYTTTSSRQIIFQTSAHGMGYSPVILAVLNESYNGAGFTKTFLPYASHSVNSSVPTDFVVSHAMTCSVDDTNITLKIELPASPGLNWNGTVTCYVLEETAG